MIFFALSLPIRWRAGERPLSKSINIVGAEHRGPFAPSIIAELSGFAGAYKDLLAPVRSAHRSGETAEHREQRTGTREHEKREGAMGEGGMKSKVEGKK